MADDRSPAIEKDRIGTPGNTPSAYAPAAEGASLRQEAVVGPPSARAQTGAATGLSERNTRMRRAIVPATAVWRHEKRDAAASLSSPI